MRALLLAAALLAACAVPSAAALPTPGALADTPVAAAAACVNVTQWFPPDVSVDGDTCLALLSDTPLCVHGSEPYCDLGREVTRFCEEQAPGWCP